VGLSEQPKQLGQASQSNFEKQGQPKRQLEVTRGGGCDAEFFFIIIIREGWDVEFASGAQFGLGLGLV
jgi:hypothetical protein